MLDPASHADPRLVSNSFEHSPSSPDWTIDQNPQAHRHHQCNPTHTLISHLPPSHPTPEFSQVPIILRYSVHSLATLKPPQISDLINEAALEFNLDPKSIQLAVRIHQNYIKISPTLYQRIAPLSTIHVKLITCCHKSLPKQSDIIPSPGTTPSTIADLTAKTNSASDPTTNAPIAISDSPSSYDLQSQNQFKPTITPNPLVVNLSQQTSVNLSSFQETPITSTPSTTSSVLLASPLQVNELETLPARKRTSADSTPSLISTSSSSSSILRKDGIPPPRNSTKKFLIHSLAHPQPRSQPSDHRDSHHQRSQRRPSKFPFLSNQRSITASAITATTSPSNHSSTSIEKPPTTNVSSSLSTIASPSVGLHHDPNGLDPPSSQGHDHLPYVDLVNDLFKDFQPNGCSTVDSTPNNSISRN